MEENDYPGGMARNKSEKSAKEPGRLKQMYQVFRMTKRYDPASVWWMALAFLIPVLLGVLAAVVLSRDNILGIILWVIAGLMTGLLGFLIVLGRKAERAAYSQIAGQAGAVGAVMKSSLPRGWTGSEMPIAVSPRTQDAVYRAVGRGGIILIGEGPATRTQRMIDDERRKIVKILPNVPITVVHVGPDPDAVPLHRLSKTMKAQKKVLNKAEVMAVSNRMTSLAKASPLPIPKGIDPTKVRAGRPR